MANGRVHPYIPNSEESVKKEMLKELGIKSAEDIFDAIPEHLRFRGNCWGNRLHSSSRRRCGALDSIGEVPVRVTRSAAAR